MWKAVKDLRKKFVLEFVKMKKGKCRACTLRQKNGNDCLATEHWKKISFKARTRAKTRSLRITRPPRPFSR